MKKLSLIALSATALAAHTAAAQGTVTLQGSEFTVDTASHHVIGPGLTQSSLVFKTNGRSFNAYVVDLDLTKGTGMRVKVDVGRDSCNTAEAITSIARRKTTDDNQYLAGINGDFFITSSFSANHEFGNAILGYPNMSCITGGKIVAPDMIDITSRENAFIIGSDGMWIDETKLKYRVLDNTGTTIVDATAVNYPRRDNEMVVYNSYMGHYTKTSANGRELVLRLADGAKWAVNKTVKFIVDSDWHNGQSAIPEDGIVISCGPDYANEFIDGLKKGDTVKLKIVLTLPAFENIKPDILEVCGGDVRILKEDVVTTEAIRWINSPSAKYARSLVGYSKDRDHVVMCAVDGNSASSGVTYYEAADVMRYLGCYDALDLDGGGSTAIWTHSHGIFNSPRDGSERAVGNGLFFVLDAPRTTQIESIRFADHSITLPRYGNYAPVVYGYNEHGQLVDTNLDGFVLSADDEFGTIAADGKSILASGTGTHILTATKDGMTATITVRIDDTAPATPCVPAYLLNGIHPVQIRLQAPVGSTMMDVAPKAYTWTITDPSVADVTPDGVLTGLKNGTTVLTGVLGESKIEIPVTVEIPTSSDIPLYSSWNAADWTVTAKSQISTVNISAADDAHGLDVEYNVTGTRGTRLALSNQKTFYSLPDGISIDLSQDGQALGSVTLNILPANATKPVAIESKDMPQVSTPGTVVFDLKSALDTDDPAIYPIQFVSMSIVPVLKTGSNTLHINAFNGTYSYVPNSVSDIAVPDITAEKLIVNIDGHNVSLPFTADRIDIFTPSGALVATAAKADAASIEAPGFYIIRASLGAKTLSTRILVK